MRHGAEGGDARSGRQRQSGRRHPKDDPVAGDEGEPQYRHDPAGCGSSYQDACGCGSGGRRHERPAPSRRRTAGRGRPPSGSPRPAAPPRSATRSCLAGPGGRGGVCVRGLLGSGSRQLALMRAGVPEVPVLDNVVSLDPAARYTRDERPAVREPPTPDCQWCSGASPAVTPSGRCTRVAGEPREPTEPRFMRHEGPARRPGAKAAGRMSSRWSRTIDSSERAPSAATVNLELPRSVPIRSL